MCRKTTFVLCTILILGIGAHATRAQSLWGYYPIHENDLQDYSGNEHHGTLVDGAAIVSDAERGWVLSFNVDAAQPSRVNCGTDDPSASGQLTVSAWIYWQGTNGFWQGIAGKSFSYDDRRWVFQLRDSDGMIQWGGADNAGLHIFSTVAPATDEWQHAVGTCDGTTSRVYINGEIVGEGAGSFAPGAAAANVTLGFAEDRNDYDESFNGRIDEIHILTRALSQAQVRDLAGGVLPDFTKARDPNPADGELAVFLPLFRWTAGDGAARHNIYLGTTPELDEQQLVSPQYHQTTYWYAGVLQPGVTYYWRVDEIEADGVTIHQGDVWSFMTQAPTAYHPDPADGAGAVSPATALTWLPGLNAFEHHLYFSDSLDAVTERTAEADKGELMAETTFTPEPLQSATTYYWRVDETTAGDVVQAGPVWSFTTFLPVDDFESYTDDFEAGEAIFQTWIDGMTNNSGSTVGYWEAPFAEQKIVHGGLQSMPLDYNNVISPYYSEAEREFESEQDWTVNGLNTLVLHVRGRTTNTPATIYTGIRDASNRVALVAHPDPNVVVTSKWVEWRVPLSEFNDAGVNPARVRTMYIGAGDTENPVPDGAGLIYIDDIYVARFAAVE